MNGLRTARERPQLPSRRCHRRVEVVGERATGTEVRLRIWIAERRTAGRASLACRPRESRRSCGARRTRVAIAPVAPVVAVVTVVTVVTPMTALAALTAFTALAFAVVVAVWNAPGDVGHGLR